MRAATEMKIDLVAIFVALTFAACGDDEGPSAGTLRVTIYGEEFIEDGIPEKVFVDGWSVDFERFIVTIGDVTAARGEDEPDVVDPQYRVFDLTENSGEQGHLVVEQENVPGGAYDHVGFRIAAGLFVQGSAIKADATKIFAWTFDTATTYAHCESTAEVDGDVATSQITIHADHLLYDDLFSETPNVAFDLVAAADDNGDADGEVTAEELAATDLSTEKRYQVGSTGIDNLWDFIEYQTGTVGHIDGEGHCEEATRE